MLVQIAPIIEAVQKVLLASFLLYASYQDIKKREVDDKVWIIALIAAMPLTIYLLLLKSRIVLIIYAMSLVTALVLGFFIAYFELMGGADIKALFVLGLTVLPQSLEVFDIPSLAIFTNGVIFSLVTIPYIVIRNLVNWKKFGKIFDINLPLSRKIILFFITYREKVKRVKSMPYAYFIFEHYEKGTRKIKIVTKVTEDTEALLKKFNEMGIKDSDYIWVSPSIPLLVYIMIGYIYYIFLGNILKIILLWRL